MRRVDIVVDREQPLPVNVNCVSYPADANAILAGRSWADTVHMAGEALGPFHAACRLPVLAGFGWRVALDRKNQRSTQVTLYFVLDGPATALHLDLLEDLVRGLHPAFLLGTVDRTPAHGAPALVAAHGALAAVWCREAEGGEPWIRKLVWRHGAVKPALVARRFVEPSDVCPELPQVVGIPGDYGDAERESERMRIAFARHYSQRIVDADGVVREGESEFLADVFPPEMVHRLGLDEAGVEAEYLAAAREVLPAQLGHHDKLGLVGLLFSACTSDGFLGTGEMRVLREAGETLGLSRETVVKYLRRFW
jgi:uncharacterized tellurite resistance protein B-like protein